jgi:hypothetical protein
MARSGGGGGGLGGAAWAGAAALLVGALIALPWERQLDTELVRDTTYDAVGPNAPIDNAAFSRQASGRCGGAGRAGSCGGRRRSQAKVHERACAPPARGPTPPLPSRRPPPGRQHHRRRRHAA